MPRLDETEIQRALEGVEGWEYQPDSKSILRRWSFKNFLQALAFVNRLGELAEEANHHPDIAFGWGYAHITLTTHDAGGVTQNDIHMAKTINDAAANES